VNQITITTKFNRKRTDSAVSAFLGHNRNKNDEYGKTDLLPGFALGPPSPTLKDGADPPEGFWEKANCGRRPIPKAFHITSLVKVYHFLKYRIQSSSNHRKGLRKRAILSLLFSALMN